jgi:hypothetical protein
MTNNHNPAEFSSAIARYRAGNPRFLYAAYDAFVVAERRDLMEILHRAEHARAVALRLAWCVQQSPKAWPLDVKTRPCRHCGKLITLLYLGCDACLIRERAKYPLNILPPPVPWATP